MLRNAKVDKNQPEIVKALRASGAAVLHCHQLKNAFDILVGYRGVLYMVEIKMPGKANTVTEGENKCLEMFEKVGCKYHVVTDIQEALAVIGAAPKVRQRDRALKLLRDRGKMTTKQLKAWGVNSPAQEVSRLKEEGHKIESKKTYLKNGGGQSTYKLIP